MQHLSRPTLADGVLPAAAWNGDEEHSAGPVPITGAENPAFGTTALLSDPSSALSEYPMVRTAADGLTVAEHSLGHSRPPGDLFRPEDTGGNWLSVCSAGHRRGAYQRDGEYVVARRCEASGIQNDGRRPAVSKTMAVDLRAMTGDGSAGDSRSNAGQSGLHSWQEAIGRRLSRSATIALLLSPVGLLIISVTRLLIVSDYNPATGLAIASSGGYADTLLGTVIPLIPIIMPYLALVFLFFNRVILAILAFAATVFVSPVAVGRPAVRGIVDRDWHFILHAPVVIIIIMTVLALLVVILLGVELLGLGFNIFMRTLATIACIAFIPLVSQLYSFSLTPNYYIELIRQPWLPAETITLVSGQSFTGYVLSDDGDWLVALRNDNRTVYYYIGADVTKRQICQLSPARQEQPLITFPLTQENKSARTPLCGSPSALVPTPSRPNDHTGGQRPLPSRSPLVPGSHASPVRSAVAIAESGKEGDKG